MLAAVQHQSEGTRYLRRFVEGSLHGPLLLLGPSGVGRRFAAMQAITELFCTGTKADSCRCASCYQIPRAIHPDLKFLDGSANIEAIREFLSSVSEYPSCAPWKCFVVDGIDHIKALQADVFLKTLEEAPALSRFILLGENKARILPTILSRCGLVRFQTLPDEFVLSVVQRHEEDASKALVYSRMGEGSAGKAVGYCLAGKLTLRDQALKILQVSAEKDFLVTFSQIDLMGDDLPMGLKLMEQLIHDVLMVSLDPMRVINVDLSQQLLNLSRKLPGKNWVTLSRGLQSIQEQAQIVTVNLKFQTKTALAEAFV